MRYSSNRQTIILLPICFIFAAFLVACGGPTEEEIGFAWSLSPHADAEAQAFSRWNNDEPPEIPPNCARCHSTTGYHDFLGFDGSMAGQVDSPAPVGTTVECEACHNAASDDLDQVTVPSGKELTGLGGNANCMACHQGRASGVQVAAVVYGLPDDTVNTELGAPNLHNRAPAATLFGGEASGGYEYAGQSYAGRYGHVISFSTCSECHDPHSLGVDAQRCSACHRGVRGSADFPAIRTSNIDYDGDGNISEGMAGEIETMQLKLQQAIDRYTAETEGVENIVLTSRFTNDAGDPYTTWTPRLMRSAFNYVYSDLDGAGYAHNPHYVLQLLYDSIQDMGGTLSGLVRP